MEKEQQFKIPRIRTIKETIQILKEIDPDTKISEHYVRELAKENKEISVKVRTKYLINIEKFIAFLNNSMV